jgi:hypothetical protein
LYAVLRISIVLMPIWIRIQDPTFPFGADAGPDQQALDADPDPDLAK